VLVCFFPQFCIGLSFCLPAAIGAIQILFVFFRAKMFCGGDWKSVTFSCIFLQFVVYCLQN